MAETYPIDHPAKSKKGQATTKWSDPFSHRVADGVRLPLIMGSDPIMSAVYDDCDAEALLIDENLYISVVRSANRLGHRLTLLVSYTQKSLAS